MPIKILKGETVDQVIDEYEKWEKSWLEMKQDEIRLATMLANSRGQTTQVAGPMISNLSLFQGNIPIIRETTIGEGENWEVTQHTSMVSGYILYFLHN